MHPIFLAMGPDFKMGSKVDSFNNVDVYPLLCKLLNLDPAPNYGTLEVVQALLVNGAEVLFFTFGVYILILLFVGLISGLFGMAACQVHRQYKRQQHKVRVVTLSRHVGNNTYDAVPLVSGMYDDELCHDSSEGERKLWELQTCQICMEQPLDTTLMPCGHLVACEVCAKQLAKCPICQKVIKGTVNTFLS